MAICIYSVLEFSTFSVYPESECLYNMQHRLSIKVLYSP